MNFIGCEGQLTPVHTEFGDGVPHVLGCTSGWIVVTEQELLSRSSQNQLLSRDDFNVLSASILAIMIVAMGLRLVLKTLNIGEKSNEKN